MASPESAASANAAVVLWQNRLRAGFVACAAILLLALSSIGITGPVPARVWLLAAAYAAVLLLVSVVVRRRGSARIPALLILAAADLGVIFGGVALLAAPPHYAMALFLSLMVLQLAHAWLGIVPALLVVGGTVFAYVALHTAAAQGTAAAVSWSVDAWLLGAYLAVAVHAIAFRARFKRQLAGLVNLFAQAQRGDFGQAYDERGGHAEDGLMLVGRAYNDLRDELAALVLTDSLTGCLNRRGFELELVREVARAARAHGDLALLAVDIDLFKRVNDTFGHLAGDTVLRELADLLAASARAGDVVGRVGGDELVILLPDADAETAGVVAERISNVVRGHHFITTRGRERVTVSIGIAAEQLADPWMAHALRARADEALYVAKRLGRDRVVIWAPGIRSRATPPQLQSAVEDDPRPGSGRAPIRPAQRAD